MFKAIFSVIFLSLMISKSDQRNLRRRITITNNNFGPGNHINNNEYPAEPFAFTGNHDIQMLTIIQTLFILFFFFLKDSTLNSLTSIHFLMLTVEF